MAVQVSRASDRILARHFNGELSELETKLFFEWLKDGVNKKICLSCDSLGELITCANIAKDYGIPYEIVTDLGMTEFDCVTTTALVIGPFYEQVLDVHFRNRPLKLA